jgi:hypothetical protein
LPTEKACSSAKVKVHSGPWYWPQFEAKLLLPGPFVELLRLKKESKPYTLQRFRAWGVVKIKSLVTILGLPVSVFDPAVYYLGRSGSEVELARPGDRGAEVEVSFDRHLDVYREWRGPGLQGLKVSGKTGWECDVEVYVDACFELTWVG